MSDDPKTTPNFPDTLSLIAAVRAAERERCAKIIRHHMDSHRRQAAIHSNPYDVLRHTQAAASLETVLERIDDP